MSDTELSTLAKKEGKALLPELYALRAGLSAVSVEKDKITAIDEKIKRFDELKRNDITQADGNINSYKEAIAESQNSINSSYRRISIIKEKSVILYFLKVILLLLPISLSSVGVFHSWSWTKARFGILTSTNYGPGNPYSIEDFTINIVLLIIAAALTFLCVVGIVYFIFLFFASFRDFNFLDSDGVFKKRKDIKEERLNISLEETKINKYESLIKSEEARIKAIVTNSTLPREIDKNQKTIDTIENERLELVIASNDMIKALELQFKNVIDKRDWKNLDLVIYYFETGRAETMKEALQLVDKELQTGTIANAVGYAAKEISENIRDGLYELRSDMVYCLDGISRQITAVGEITAAGFKAQVALQNESINTLNRIAMYSAEQSAYTAELVSHTNMQNALIAKADASSEQLANDISYMKNLSESAEIRRRNNQ